MAEKRQLSRADQLGERRRAGQRVQLFVRHPISPVEPHTHTQNLASGYIKFFATANISRAKDSMPYSAIGKTNAIAKRSFVRVEIKGLRQTGCRRLQEDNIVAHMMVRSTFGAAPMRTPRREKLST